MSNVNNETKIGEEQRRQEEDRRKIKELKEQISEQGEQIRRLLSEDRKQNKGDFYHKLIVNSAIVFIVALVAHFAIPMYIYFTIPAQSYMAADNLLRASLLNWVRFADVSMIVSPIVFFVARFFKKKEEEEEK